MNAKIENHYIDYIMTLFNDLINFNTVTNDSVTTKTALRELVLARYNISRFPQEFWMVPERAGDAVKCQIYSGNRLFDLIYEVTVNSDSELITVVQVNLMDIHTIKKNCELSPTGPYIEHVRVICDKSRPDRGALEGVLIPSPDGYIRLPEFDRPGFEAWVACRYNFGTSVRSALYHPETKTAWCGPSYNFITPSCLAVRAVRDGGVTDIELYLKNGLFVYEVVWDVDRARIGSNVNCMWVKMNIAEDFEKTSDVREYALAHPEFTNLHDYLNQINSKIPVALSRGDYAEILSLAEAFLAVPHSDDAMVCKNTGHSGGTVQRYNRACALAKLGRQDEAMQQLLAIEASWSEWTSLREDGDLESLHDRTEWLEMLARHP